MARLPDLMLDGASSLMHSEEARPGTDESDPPVDATISC